MLITSTMHNHCTFCDGHDTAETMIEKAIECGFTDFGMSCHGYAPFDLKYSVSSEESYLSAMAELKVRYADRIRVWCGVEEDYFAQVKDRSAYDYTIGDVHYAKDRSTGELMPVDGSARAIADVCERIYGGSAERMVRGYYADMVSAVDEMRPDIIGHFDLIVKNNSGGRFFDEDSAWYRDAALEALDACAAYGIIFEVNSGAVARRKRDFPYPAALLLRRLNELGCRVTLSTDCHYVDRFLAGLDISVAAVRDAGFREVWFWEDGRFVPRSLDS